MEIIRHFYQEAMRFRSFPKTHFCNYIFRHNGASYWGKYNNTTRRDFCTQLMHYKHIDCPSASLNNMVFPESPGLPNNCSFFIYRMLEKLCFIKHHKFTIAFENSSRPGYVSEKIAEPFAVGSIPIYWGCKRIADYYNTEAFINCHDYPNFDAVIDHIKEVDADPVLYEKYLNAPPTLPHHYYHETTVIAKYRRLADEIHAEAMRRRNATAA